MSAQELRTVLEGLAWFSLGSAIALYVMWLARWCAKQRPPLPVAQQAWYPDPLSFTGWSRWVRCPRCSSCRRTSDVVERTEQHLQRAVATCKACRLAFEVLPVEPAEPPPWRELAPEVRP